MSIIGRFIGINYKNSRNELAGCINDANDAANTVAPLLSSPPVLLLEQNATKASIIRFIREALQLLRAGDWLWLHYSGHGTQVPDQTGDEPDRLDEALCPYDLDKQLLFDDELAQLFALRPAGSQILFVSDCCHSGSITREPSRRKTARFIPFETISGRMSHLSRNQLAAERRDRAALSPDIFHLSGCKDDEVSYDATFGDRANGALTYHALKALHNLPRGATMFDWHKQVRLSLPSNRYQQTPQFNGPDWITQIMPGFELPQPPPPVTTAVEDKPPELTIVAGEWQSTRIEWRKRAA